ncbi:MAG: hypothetical protein LBS51_08865 [Oscillospiraceae bacterium]|jgi:YbbR domain-containing protein|nr:hypothetical protein [Oscillospiraceae bacterium]
MLKKIKGFFSSRTFYIAFSIIASVALWIYVEFEVNPDESNFVGGIPVEFLNAELVSDRNLVITSVSSETVSLGFTGRRNAVAQLNNANVKVTVDLSQIKGVGRSMLEYTEVYPDGVSEKDFTVDERSADYIVFVVENLAEKSLQVYGEYSGGVAAEGYQADPMEFLPDMITVYGPSARLAEISRALVTVRRENLTKTVTEELPFTLLDGEGVELGAEGLTFSAQTVAVTVPIKMVREVPLKVNLAPGAGADDSNTVCTVTPETITLSGDAADMQINYILLGTVDLTSFGASLTETLPIIIPNGLKNLTGLTDATVTVKITGLETLRLQTANIQTVNVPDGYAAELVTQSLDVTIRGKPYDVGRLQSSNVMVVADLSELGSAPSTHTVPARVNVDGDFEDIGAIGEYTVTVTLSEQSTEPEPESGGT